MNCVHLKPVSHSIAVSIQETASQLTDELPVCNSIQYSNSEKYGLPSSFLTKQEERDDCYSTVPLKHTTRRTVTRVTLGTTP